MNNPSFFNMFLKQDIICYLTMFSIGIIIVGIVENGISLESLLIIIGILSFSLTCRVGGEYEAFDKMKDYYNKEKKETSISKEDI